MNHKHPSLRKIGLQITLLTIGTSGLGAVLAFLFLNVINPLPQGEASVQGPDTAGIILFILVAVLAFVILGLVGRRLSRPIETWYDRLESGTPAAELPLDVARRVLNWPFINAAVVVAGWAARCVNAPLCFPTCVRDFTSLTERLAPETLVDLINRYMTAMVSAIVDHGGVVTRFGGDSILAVFGSPLNAMTDHADRAVNAALHMRQALQDFNQDATGDPVANGRRPVLENGIGIATGPVIAGNVGGKERIEYTVMGDAANLASRLEGLTSDLNHPILISAETFAALGSLSARPLLNARPLPDVPVKGKVKPVTIYGLG